MYDELNNSYSNISSNSSELVLNNAPVQRYRFEDFVPNFDLNEGFEEEFELHTQDNDSIYSESTHNGSFVEDDDLFCDFNIENVNNEMEINIEDGKNIKLSNFLNNNWVDKINGMKNKTAFCQELKNELNSHKGINPIFERLFISSQNTNENNLNENFLKK
jgi:hypothetical protein